MIDFPFFNTKELSTNKKYNLNDSVERCRYFNDKMGEKIEELKAFLDNNTFVAFLVAKKSAGKGTYSKLFQEIIGSDRVSLISVGDVVRNTHRLVHEDAEAERGLLSYLEENYRSVMPLDRAYKAFIDKDQSTLIPTEFILALLKREIDSIGKKAVFIDGFPRSFDQVSYSLYLRDLINYRDDPDFFVLIDVPETVIDERIKSRVICPICHSSRSLKLFPTRFVRYDVGVGEYYLVCDNKECGGYDKQRLLAKEGDSAGRESIRERLDIDGKLIEYTSQIYGVPKVLIRNTIPIDRSCNLIEDYEITPMYSYEGTEERAIEVKESPWIIKDDSGVDSVSLLAAPAVLSMIDQIHSILIG